MRKSKHLTLLFSLLALIVSGCSNNNSDGLRQILNSAGWYGVKTEGSTAWQLMSADGTTILPDTFITAPSVALDGIFTAYAPGGLAVYKIAADNSISVIADSLRYTGAMSGGLMPVCRKDSPIEVIDKSGATLFTLDSINAATPYYSCGRLCVRFTSSKLWGAVDTKGRIAVAPEYEYLSTFNDGHAIGIKDSELYIVDTKGGSTQLADGPYEMVTPNFLYGHVIVRRKADGVRCIVDTKGHIATLPSSTVPLLLSQEGSIFMNHLGEIGIMGWKGEIKLEPTRRELLAPLSGSDRLLASADSIFTVLNPDGSAVGSFPKGTATIEPLFTGSAYMAVSTAKPTTYTLYTTDLQPVSTPKLIGFDRHITLCDIILSDRQEDHQMFNTADPGDDIPEWMQPDSTATE